MCIRSKSSTLPSLHSSPPSFDQFAFSHPLPHTNASFNPTHLLGRVETRNSNKMGWSLRLLGFMACLFFIGLLVSEVTESRGSKASPPKLAAAMGRLRNLQLHGQSRDMNPLQASKRKVPNGPDPIHNRRAGSQEGPRVRRSGCGIR